MFQPCLYLTELVKDTGKSDEVFVSCDAGTTWISLQNMVTVSSFNSFVQAKIMYSPLICQRIIS